MFDRKILTKTPKVLAVTVLIMAFFMSYAFAGNYPFPQNFTYPYGIKATNANTAKLSTMYTSWKSTYITSSGCPVGVRVQRPQDGYDTVSEGIGYGMVICVYFDDQATFNGLWQYKTNFNDSHGLMNWQISSGGTVAGQNSAIDGDEDIAFALIEADKQWGTGTYNYLSLAQGEIAKIKANEIDSATYHVKPGDAWDSYEFPAYYMPAYYRLFGEVTNDAAFWNSVVATCASHIQSARNTSYGLVPTNINHDGTRNGNSYDYDSCRTPWRYANDYVWNGDTNSKGEIDLLAGFFGPKGAANVVDGYAVDTGNAAGSNHNAAFVGPAACSLMTGPSVATQATLNSFYSYVEGLDVTSGYYQGCIQMITLLLLSGNLPDFRHEYTPTVTPTINMSLTKTPTPTVTQTFTKTPVPPPTNKLNLEVMSTGSSDACTTQTFGFQYRITNWETTVVNTSNMAIKIWVDTADVIAGSIYNARKYDSTGTDQGTVTASIAQGAGSGCAGATESAVITIAATDIPANGGYIMVQGALNRGGYQTPFDAGCNDYTKLLSTWTSYVDNPTQTLYQGTNLVCEYLDAVNQDPNTGKDPCTGANGCAPATSPTNTPFITNTYTRTATTTFTRTNTPSATPSCTNTPVPATATYTATATRTATPSLTYTPSVTNTQTWTATPSRTFTATASGTNTPAAPSATYTPTVTATFTQVAPTSTFTITRTYTPIFTLTPVVPSFTATATYTVTRTNTPVPPTQTYTATATLTATSTFTLTPAPSGTMTATSTKTATMTATPTFTYSATDTPSLTATPTRTSTPTATQTMTFTISPTFTDSPTETPYAGSPTETWTSSSTPTVTMTGTDSVTSTSTATATCTLTQTDTLTDTATPTYTPTATMSFTPADTFTSTPANTAAFTAVSTSTVTPADTLTPTPVGTFTATQADTQTATPADTSTATPLNTLTSTPTATAVNTLSNTATNTPLNTATRTPVNTFTATAISTATSTPTSTAAPATATNTPAAVPTQQHITITGCTTYPNPYVPSSGGINFGYKLSRGIRSSDIYIYSSGYRLIRHFTQADAQGPGPNTIQLKNGAFSGLAGGVYFYTIKVTADTGEIASSAIGKMIIFH